MESMVGVQSSRIAKANTPAVRPGKPALSNRGTPLPPPRTLSVPLIGGLAVAGVALVLLALFVFGGQQSKPATSSPVGQLLPVSTLKATDYHSLVVSPTDPQRVWFGSHSGIQESKDGGRTWQPLGGMSGDAMSMAISSADPNRVYIAGHDVFKRSTDGGRTWQDVQTDLPGSDLHGFAGDPGDAQHIYALVAGQGVFESADAGNKWKPLAAQPPGASGPLTVAAGRPATLYAATSLGVMRSKDGGQSWHPAGSGLPQGQADVRALTSVPGKPQELYAGTTNGLYHTKDGGTTWQQAALSGQLLVALAASQSEPLRLYALSADGAVYNLEGTALAR